MKCAFKSSISGDITQEQYEYARTIYEEYCTSLMDYHVHYLLIDVSILLDALVYWQNVIYNQFKIDLLQCHSLPSAAKESMHQYSRQLLELITDPVIYQRFQDNLHGGLTISALRFCEIEDHEGLSIKYFDVKSLYASTQIIYRHPIGKYRHLNPTPSPKELMDMAKTYDKKNDDTGFLCIVDLRIPHALHPLLSDFPITYQKISIDPKFYPQTSKWHFEPKSKTKKLIPSLFNPKNYGISMLTLQFLVYMGLIVDKVHDVIGYEQNYLLREFTEICQQLRRSGCDMDDVIYKLIPNSVFGKFIENAYLYTNSRFVFERTLYKTRVL